MTEVPEHLLRRSKERRAAMTGEPVEGGAPSTSTDVEPAAAATPAASGGAAPPAAAPPPVAPAYTGPPPSPPRKQRVPMWAMPVLVALPLWAILYSGAFGERKAAAEGPVAVGQALYGRSCGTCHGPSGGGGSGPALGDVTKTFPKFEDHVSWVETGSKPFTGTTYGSGTRVATGGMPPFEDSLTKEQIVGIVCHERVNFGDAELPPECAEGKDTASESE